MDKKLKDYLDKNEIKYKLHKHIAVFRVIESKKIDEKIPGLHCKTLFLKDNNENFYLVGMPAEKRLNTKQLRKHLGVRKLYFASSEELLEKLKVVPGSVSIFGMINNKNQDVMLILDKEVWTAESVGFHPNINTETLEIKHIDLERYYKLLKCEKEVIEL